MSIQEHAPAPKEELNEARLKALAGDYEYSTPVVDTPPQDPATRVEARKAEAPKRKVPKWVLPVALAGVVAIGGTAGTVALLNQPAAVEEGDPGDGITDPITEPDNGEGAPVAGPEVPSVESLVIPEGLSDEAVAKLIVEDRLSNWVNSGFNDAAYENWQIHTNDDGEFVAAVVAPYDESYRSALFTDAAESNVDLEELHAAIVEDALNTNNPSNGIDLAPYSQTFRYDSSEELSRDDTQRTIRIGITIIGNSDQNSVGEKFGQILAGMEGTSNTLEITLVKQADGTEKISRLFKG